MCGIAGLVQSESIDLRSFRRMLDLLSHRGPDDEGFVVFSARGPICLGGDDTVSFDPIDELPYRPVAHISDFTREYLPAYLIMGHRRLSIVDLSPFGHQPMSYANRYWIVFNGEIFNYIELREELKCAGYHFRTNSDTEVILAGYDKWGESLLDRCNGMWALAIYDCQTRRLFLARDRFGIKPLYYHVSSNGRSLAFASEIKAFSALPDWHSEIASQPVFDFLAWGVQDHGPETMFRNVYQLPPGHFVSIPLGTSDRLTQPLARILPTTCWYDLRSKRQVVPAGFGQAAERFREIFFDAVRLRMRADVPLGSCLSGGLDSSSIVCAVRSELQELAPASRQKTFSSCSVAREVDEREFISEVTKNTSIDETHVFPDGEEFLDRLDDLVWTQDEPFASGSIFAQWCLFRAAREQGVTVVLDGQGADEQLAGYHGFLGARLAGLIRAGDFNQFISEFSAVRQLHGYTLRKLASYFLANLAPGSIRPLGALIGMSQMTRHWIDVKALGAVDRDPFVPLGARTTSVRSLSLAQMAGSNLQMLLHWEDRNSMAHSIEARVPFLDYRLVEYTLNLPEVFKLDKGITKRVLRKSMQGIVPDKVLSRIDKKGFLTPEEHWLKRDYRSEFAERLDEAVALSNGIIRPSMRSVFSRVASDRAGFSHHIWRVICFGAWLKKFNVKI